MSPTLPDLTTALVDSSVTEVALHFGVTVAWLEQVMATDAFLSLLGEAGNRSVGSGVADHTILDLLPPTGELR